ncbi:MAG: DUF2461 domain-containing protein, partial [Pseudomonadota bacterium]
SENNNREWYHEHKDDIKAHLLEPFSGVLEQVSQKLARTRLPLKGSSKTMFRMNRDTRFSNNKKPYKENIGGLLTPSGTKNEASGLVYLHLDSNGGMMAAGFYKFNARQLEPIRQKIIEQPNQWRAVRKALFKAELDLSRENALKSMPRGFNSHESHEYADDIKLKNLIVQQPLTKSAWLKGEVLDQLTGFSKSIAPLIQFRP